MKAVMGITTVMSITRPELHVELCALTSACQGPMGERRAGHRAWGALGPAATCPHGLPQGSGRPGG